MIDARMVLIAAGIALLLAGCPRETTPPGSNDSNNRDTQECVELVNLSASEAQPAAVSLYFEALDCETGEPVDGLDISQFEIAEENSPVDEATPIELLPRNEVRTYANVVLDLSGGVTPQLQSGADELVTELIDESSVDRTRLGIYLFDGADQLDVWQRPVGDAEILRERIDALEDIEAVQTESRNLNGAIAEAVAATRDHIAAVNSRNNGGVLSTGEAIVMTTGPDTAEVVDASGAVSAIEEAHSATTDEAPAVRTRVVTTEEGAVDALAEQAGRHLSVTTAEPDGLGGALQGVVDEIAFGRQGRYLLGYCSGLRDDGGQVEISVAELGSEPAQFEIAAGEFTDGCSTETLSGEECGERECGGFLCGGCSDTAETCGGDNGGECVYYCLDAVVCEDEDITTDLGFEMNCFMGPTVTECDSQCVDVSIDDNHCGACGVECTAPDSECVDGVCLCSGGERDCGGECVDVSTSEDHCGVCGNVCPEGIDCQDGVCPCEGEEIACDGQCVDVWTNDDHCYECNNACGADRTCESGECVCEEPLEECSGTCVDTTSSDEYCGDCNTSCGQNRSCESGECVCVADGEQYCDGSCRDVTANDDYCGGCDTSCGEAQSCQEQSCVCDDSALTACGGDCIDVVDNDEHCGGCNNSCEAGEFCDGTTCEPEPVLDQRVLRGGIDHTCALRTDGDGICWGRDGEDQATIINATFVDISPGDRYTCGVDTDGAALCWGRNIAGESVAPTDKAFVDVDAGWSHTCGVETDQSLHCWGSDGDGKSSPPTETNFSEVVVGWKHSCALTTEGDVSCWGDDSDGKTDPPTDREFETINSGMNHTCGIDVNDEIDCWGASGSGQLDVPAGTFEDVAAGGAHTCGIETGGAIDCWGSDTSGQGESGIPSGEFVDITAGFQYTCALDVDGVVTCWGENEYEQGDFPGWE